MAKAPPLPCGTCKGTGKVTRQFKGVYDPKSKQAETVYRTVTCDGPCGGSGYINR